MLDDINNGLALIIQQTKLNSMTLAWIAAIPWGVFFLSLFFPGLLWLGIIPRRIRGLPGIVFAPLLHAHFNHLFYNTIPLLVLSDFLLIQGLSHFLIITCVITLLSGFLTWLFAKPGIHLGASSVVTGYWGLLVCNIYETGTFVAIILGFISLYAFAGIFFGIFPKERGVSWEGHLFGLLAGVIVSLALNR